MAATTTTTTIITTSLSPSKLGRVGVEPTMPSTVGVGKEDAAVTHEVTTTTLGGAASAVPGAPQGSPPEQTAKEGKRVLNLALSLFGSEDPEPVVSAPEPPRRLRPSLFPVKTPMEQVRRLCQAALNKLTRQNFAKILDRDFLGEIVPQIQDAESLKVLVSLVLEKAALEAKFEGYGPLYADMCLRLKERCKETYQYSASNKKDDSSSGRGDSEESESENETFRSALLNCCQQTFEELLPLAPFEASDEELRKAAGEGPDAEEELQLRYSKQKEKFLGTLKIVGLLVVRKLITTRTLRNLVNVLLFEQQPRPEPCRVEAAVHLLKSVGAFLESPEGLGREAGVSATSWVVPWFHQLEEFRKPKQGTEGSYYPARIRFLIQDLLDRRSSGWEEC